MSNVLVIGNGFDLYHNLPTRYTDFLFFVSNWEYFKELYKNASVEVADAELLEIRLDSDGRLTKDSIEDFGKYRGVYSSKYIDEFDISYKNKWVDYFNELIRTSKIGKNWIDFEYEMQVALQIIQDCFDALFDVSGAKQTYIKSTSTKMLSVIRIFAGLSPEAFLSNMTSNSKRNYDIIAENKQSLLSLMKNELDKLIRCLNIYLLEFVSRIECVVYSEQISKLNDVELINFNYTYTYNTVYGDRNLKYHHEIHGDMQEQNLVLGISDEAFPDTTDYIYFQKFFQRIQKKTGSYYREWLTEPEYKTYDDTPKEVYFMGHSLAETDKGILADIFLNDYVLKITIFYYNQESYENMVINLVKMFDKTFVIENTANNRIVFKKLKPPIKGKAR